MTTSTSYLSNLTPLRGLAALLVLLFHFDLFVGGPFPTNGALLPAATSMLIKKGYLMVDFFFVLSGFIISHVYGEYFRNGYTKEKFKKFMIARFARIYPLHLFTFGWALLLALFIFSTGRPLSWIEKLVFDPWAIPTNLVLLQAMGVHTFYTWNAPSWSISVEWWMYVLFPLLAGPFFRMGNAKKGLWIGVILAAYIVLIFVLNNHNPSPFVRTLNVGVFMGAAFVRCFLGFTLGMVFYQLYRKEWAKRMLGNGHTLLISTAGMLLCMHFALPDVVTVCFFPFIILSAAYGSAGVNRVLTIKPLQRLGDLSYSIYLVNELTFHTVVNVVFFFYPALAPAENQPFMPLSLPIVWLIGILWIWLVMGISMLTYRFVELPMRRLINARFTTPKPIPAVI